MDAGLELADTAPGTSRRQVLLALKRRGPSTLTELAAELDLARSTLRGHLQALAGRGFVIRKERRRARPGRPEMVYRVADAGEAPFPRQAGAMLRALAEYLIDAGREDLLDGFVAARASSRAAAARERVRGLTGAARFAEVARIFSEEQASGLQPGSAAVPRR